MTTELEATKARAASAEAMARFYQASAEVAHLSTVIDKLATERDTADAEVTHLRSLYTHEHAIAGEMLDRALAAEAENRHLVEEVARLRVALAKALDWFENAPVSYANGNVHNGLDEGDVIGGQMHDELTEQIRCALHGFALTELHDD